MKWWSTIQKSSGRSNKSKYKFSCLICLIQNIIFSEATSKLHPLFDEHVLNSDTFNVSVKPTPPDGGGLAYYNGPSVDGRRVGAFYLNTQNLKAQRKYLATIYQKINKRKKNKIVQTLPN